MTRVIDPEYNRLADLVRPYWFFDEEKGEVIIPKDAPKEIHEAAKRMDEIFKKYKDE